MSCVVCRRFACAPQQNEPHLNPKPRPPTRTICTERSTSSTKMPLSLHQRGARQTPRPNPSPVFPQSKSMNESVSSRGSASARQGGTGSETPQALTAVAAQGTVVCERTEAPRVGWGMQREGERDKMKLEGSGCTGGLRRGGMGEVVRPVGAMGWWALGRC